jgi:hypothetical protein
MEPYVQLYPRLTSALEGSGWSLDLRKRVPVLIVQEDEWAPEPIWSCLQNIVPTSARTRKHPARNVPQSRPS